MSVEEASVEFNWYQQEAVKTAVFKEDIALAYLGLGLVNEAGEVAGKLKKVFRGDKTLEASEQAIVDELGDVLWYVANLADVLGYDLSQVAERNVDKLRDRKERGVIKGDGDQR